MILLAQVVRGFVTRCDRQREFQRAHRQRSTSIYLKHFQSEESDDERVETAPIMHAETVLTIEVGQAVTKHSKGKCLMSNLFFATAILGLLDCNKGMALSMLGYTVQLLMFVYVLMFTISLSHRAEFDEQYRCARGRSMQAPMPLIGADIRGSIAGALRMCQRVFFVDFSACISKAWTTRMGCFCGCFVCLK